MNPSSTRIIINADDFGLGPGINEGIIRLAENKKISSTSITACGSHFEQGVESLLTRAQGLGMGVHICLDEEKPVLPPGEIPSLVDVHGQFHSRGTLMRKLARGTISMKEVTKEIDAQIEKVKEAGINPTHIDGHGHIHVYPWLSNTFTSIAKQHRITKSRMTLEPLFSSSHGWKQRPLARILLNHWSRKSMRKGFLSTVHTPQSFFGVSVGGSLSEAALDQFPIRPGVVNEIMTHPGLPTPEEKTKYSAWRYSWEQEFQALLNRADHIMNRYDATLIHFGEMA